MNTQILLFINNCLQNMICTLLLYLCGYQDVLLEYEPARRASGNNDRRVKWLTAMSNGFLFHALIYLFICLLLAALLKCTGNLCEDVIVLTADRCHGAVFM